MYLGGGEQLLGKGEGDLENDGDRVADPFGEGNGL